MGVSPFCRLPLIPQPYSHERGMLPNPMENQMGSSLEPQDLLAKDIQNPDKLSTVFYVNFLRIKAMQVGQTVKIRGVRDRISPEIQESLKKDRVGKIQGFKMVDGSGVGVVVSFQSGLKTWFFPDEIEPA